MTSLKIAPLHLWHADFIVACYFSPKYLLIFPLIKLGLGVSSVFDVSLQPCSGSRLDLWSLTPLLAAEHGKNLTIPIIVASLVYTNDCHMMLAIQKVKGKTRKFCQG